MFLYEAVEYLFDELQASNTYQFRNYLNLNIDNHFSSQFYASNHHYPSSSAGGGASTTGVSLTLLSTNANKQSNQKSIHNQQQQQQHTTLTLPNNLNINGGVGGGFNLPVIMQQPTRMNEVGSRLHSSYHQDAVAMTTVPLTAATAKISMDPHQNGGTSERHTTITKSSFIDLPRSMLPSFFNDTKPPQARR